MIWYCGIDPGLSGGIAFINSKSRSLRVYDMPTISLTGRKSAKTGKPKRKNILDIAEIKDIFQNYRPRFTIIEMVQISSYQVQGKFHQSASSVATNHRNQGILIGLLVALELPFAEIKARQWQQIFFKAAGKETKNRAYKCACEIHPRYAKEFKGPRGAIKDGICDAVLMATVALERDIP